MRPEGDADIKLATATGDARYLATAHWEEPWWVVRVDGIGATQARTLAAVPEWAADMIALMIEADVDPREVEVDVDLHAGVEEGIAVARRLAEDARRARAEATATRVSAVKGLVGAGLTYADISALLGVSKWQVGGAARS